MTAKRFQYSAEKIGNDWSIEITDKETKEPFDVGYIEINDVYSQTLDNVEFIVELLNQLHEENDELRQEVELLRKGLDAYENAIPVVCTCEQVRDVHSEMFDFSMEQMDFYKKHPNRVTIVIDEVKYD